MARWLLALAAGCSEYDLSTKPPTEAPPTETTPTETTPTETTPTETTPTETTPPVETTPPEPIGCDQVGLLPWSWSALEPFAHEHDPVDALGVPFWDPTADLSEAVPVLLPSLDIPIGTDRAYVTTFNLAALPPMLVLDLQSDDGLWVWVNGSEIGHWGGDWQQEGCVNENANCLVTLEIPPIDVTPFLVEGINTLAVRVSNPLLNAYFDLLPSCVDPETEARARP